MQNNYQSPGVHTPSAYHTMSNFFLLLAVYWILANFLRGILFNSIAQRVLPAVGHTQMLFMINFIQAILFMLLLIPIIIVMFLLRKVIRDRAQGDHRAIDLFDVTFFTIVFSIFLMEILSIITSGMQNQISLMVVFSIALIMLLAGKYLLSRSLQIISYIYALVPVFVLPLFFFIRLLLEREIENNLSALGFTNILVAFFYTLYPSIGCFILFYHLRKVQFGRGGGVAPGAPKDSSGPVV